MKKRMSRLLALLLTLAMVLPMAAPLMPVSAEETVTELPTETVPGDTPVEDAGEDPVFSQWHFADETDLNDFDLYQSGTSKFVVNDGMLMADGTDGEQKAILTKDVSTIKTVSVNIIPGASGTIYGGLYLGAKNPTNDLDGINSMAFLIRSDFTGWTDAPNRIDIIQGRFDGSWKTVSTTISESGKGNNLFSGGVKQPLNLKLSLSEGVILLTLSLVSNPGKFVQLMYEVDPEDLDGTVGLRSFESDTCYDKFTVNHDYVPQTLHQGVKLDGTGLNSYAKTTAPMTQKPATIEAWVNMEQLTNGAQRQAIISNYTAMGLGSNSAGTWGLYTTESGALYYTEISATGSFNQGLGINVWNNTWTHIALVRAQGVLYLYINGELVKSVSNSAVGETTSLENYLTIGYCTVGGSTGINSMKGEIGDIRLWSTERTQDQLQADMYRELDGTEEGLIQHWTFDEQTNGIVTNKVSGGLDCELLGHTQIGDQEIKRWDFSSADQISDFTVYADEGTSGSFAIADGMLKATEDESQDLKAVLGEKIDDIQSVSVDMHPGLVHSNADGANMGTWAVVKGTARAVVSDGVLKIDATTMPATYNYTGVNWKNFLLETEVSFDSQYAGIVFRGNGTHNTIFRLTDHLILSHDNSSGWPTAAGIIYPSVESTYTYGSRVKVRITVQDCKATIQTMTVGTDTDWVTVYENYDLSAFDNNMFGTTGTVGLWTRKDSALKVYQFQVTDTDTGAKYQLWETENSADVNSGTWQVVHGTASTELNDSSLTINAATMPATYNYTGVNWENFVLETEAVFDSQYAGIVFRGNGTYNVIFRLTDHLILAFDNSTGWPTQAGETVSAPVAYTYPYGSRVKVRITVQDCKATIQTMLVGTDTDWVTVFENFDLTTFNGFQAGTAGTVGLWTRKDSALKIYQFQVTDTDTGEKYDLFATRSSGFVGGFHVGMQTEPSHTAWSAESLNIRAGMLQENESLKNYGEIQYLTAANGEVSALGTATNTDFFTNASASPVRLQLDFSGGELTTTMTRLDDPAKQVTAPITLTEDALTGKLALFAHRSAVNYDNLTIVYAAPEEKQEQTEQDTLYDNAGSVLYGDVQPWRLTKDLTATPYTLEAWVKIPEGVDDGVTGYIVGNGNRGSSVTMQMITNGNLRLMYRVENADMTVTDTYYDVNVDLRNSRWTHVAYTCDVAKDTVVCYINGEAVKTWDDAGLQAITIPDHIQPANLFSIGCQESWGSSLNKLPAWIADVRLWDSPLTADEVKASMMTQYTLPREGLLLNMPLDEQVDGVFADLSGNGNTLAPYVAQLNLAEQTHEPGAYSIVVIPDQQILTAHYPEQLNNMYQWIADNREKENIQMVITVGDNVDHNGNVTEWERARAAWELLPDDLPFAAVPGNHDYDTYGGEGNRNCLTLMNQHFPQSLFAGYSTEIGFFDEINSANHWQAFDVNGNQYLVLALEYQPQNDVIAWANDVVEAHPDHQVIMVTHSYVSTYGTLDLPKLWSEFMSRHENIIMAFSGHVLSTSIVRRTDLGVNGNQVHQMLLDAQFMDVGIQPHLGMVGILRFNADGTRCDVSYYSTDRGMYEVDSNFTLTLPMQEHGFVAAVGAESYTSVADAIANANGGVVKLLQSTEKAITVDTDVTIDLAGNTLSKVTVAEGVTLTLIDTATDDYEGTYGTANVSGAVVGGENYLLANEGSVYSAHAYRVALTHISLDSVSDALGYKAKLYGDAVVQSKAVSVGFHMWIDGGEVNTYTIDAKEVFTLRLKNILANNGGEMPINATAFVIFAGNTKTSAAYTTTMKQTLQTVNAAWAGFTKTQQAAVKTLCDLYYDTVSAWELTNIYPAA